MVLKYFQRLRSFNYDYQILNIPTNKEKNQNVSILKKKEILP